MTTTYNRATDELDKETVPPVTLTVSETVTTLAALQLARKDGTVTDELAAAVIESSRRPWTTGVVGDAA